MRLFSSERIMSMMDTLGLDEDTPIDQKILSNAVENAQKNVESRNFRARKNVLEYDDVMNTQREMIYGQRPIDQKILSNAVENAQKNVESRNFRARKNVLEYDDVMNTQREMIYGQRRQVLDGENLKDMVLNNLRRVRNFRARKNVLEYDDVMNTQREMIYGQRRQVLDGENLKDMVLNNLRRVIDFRARKNVLEYDDVMNTQREMIYGQRRQVLDGENLKDMVLNNLRRVIDTTVATVTAEQGGICNQQELSALLAHMDNIYFPKGSVQFTDDALAAMKPGELEQALYDHALQTYTAKESLYGEKLMRELERVVTLRVVDEYWMDHIDAMDELKQGVGLRAYGQHDPVIEYREQGFEMFEATINAIQEETVRRMFLVRVQPAQDVKREKVAKEIHAVGNGDSVVKKQPVHNAANKVGPNDPCPCGSGKKYKKCCREKDIAAGRQ